MNIRTDTADTGPALSLALPGDYVQLMKPRVMSLVLFTALVGMALAPAALHPLTGFTALLCIAAGAGASGALNMWYDADIDAIMSRTAGRPVPQGRVTPGEALGFGLTLSIFSVFTMGVLVNWLAAGLLAFTIFFYAAVYTMWLKRRTAQNIVIGGLAGALPPAVGWAAAADSLSLTPLVLVALIFLWTPAHFWALALYRCEDYARARVPMLPVTSGEAATRVQILLYTVLTVAASALPLVLGFAAYVYMAAAVVGGALFLALAVKVAAGGRRPREAAQRDAMRLFGFSILYLFALFAALLIEAMLHLAPGAAA